MTRIKKIASFQDLPRETQAHIGTFLTRGEYLTVRETNRSNAITFGTRPLVIYRVRILRTLSGGLPDGSSDSQLSKKYTLYSDAFSSLPRAEDINFMAEDLWSDEFPNNNTFTISENGIMGQLTKLFEDIPGCQESVPRNYNRYFFYEIHEALRYTRNTRDFYRFGFSNDEFANLLASRKEQSYILSKTIKFSSTEGWSDDEKYYEKKINFFLSKLREETRECAEIAEKKFSDWGGIEKLKQLLDNLTLTTQIRVERISNPQKISYGSETSSGKRRRD